jgi:hypothetical protein
MTKRMAKEWAWVMRTNPRPVIPPPTRTMGRGPKRSISSPTKGIRAPPSSCDAEKSRETEARLSSSSRPRGRKKTVKPYQTKPAETAFIADPAASSFQP